MDKNRKILAKMFSDFGSDAKQSIDYVRGYISKVKPRLRWR